jgi:hypothetical protein
MISYARRSYIEQHPRLSAALLYRQGLLKFGSSAPFHLIPGVSGVSMDRQGLTLWRRDGGGGPGAITPDGAVLVAVQRIAVEWTSCAFGGTRPWFLCPRCHTRRGDLYAAPCGPPCECRECRRLHYRTQSMRPAQRLLGRAEKVWSRYLGESVWPGSRCPPMRSHTRSRLRDAAAALEDFGVAMSMQGDPGFRRLCPSARTVDREEVWRARQGARRYRVGSRKRADCTMPIDTQSDEAAVRADNPTSVLLRLLARNAKRNADPDEMR